MREIKNTTEDIRNFIQEFIEDPDNNYAARCDDVLIELSWSGEHEEGISASFSNNGGQSWKRKGDMFICDHKALLDAGVIYSKEQIYLPNADITELDNQGIEYLTKEISSQINVLGMEGSLL